VIAIEFEKSSFVVRENILNHNKDAKNLVRVFVCGNAKENLKHLFVLRGEFCKRKFLDFWP
jgi:hypothetical protein